MGAGDARNEIGRCGGEIITGHINHILRHTHHAKITSKSTPEARVVSGACRKRREVLAPQRLCPIVVITLNEVGGTDNHS